MKVRNGSWPCKNAAAGRSMVGGSFAGTSQGCSRPDGVDQWLDAEDVHHTGQIVGQDV